MTEKKDSKNEPCGTFLRTVIRTDIYERIKAFAQRYSTGQGNWDFGVAVQILLEHYEESQLQSVNEKINILLQGLENKPQEPEEEEQFEEFLGGKKEKI